MWSTPPHRYYGIDAKCFPVGMMKNLHPPVAFRLNNRNKENYLRIVESFAQNQSNDFQPLKINRSAVAPLKGATAQI